MTAEGLEGVSPSNDYTWLCQPSSQEEGDKPWMLCKILGRRLSLPGIAYQHLLAVNARREKHAMHTFRNYREDQVSPAVLPGDPRPRYT